MKIDLLDPVVEASPGHSAPCRVRVTNDSNGPSAYRLRVVGLYDVDVEYPLGVDPLPAGAEADFEVSLDVPREFAPGRHALGVEITSDRRDERPVLTGVTVDVSSIQKVALRVNPSTIVGRIRGRFRVEIDNREDRVVDLDITGQGQDLDIRFGRPRVRLRPGDSISISGSVRGERRLVRDPVHHVLTVAATGRSAPVYADAAFQQRPLLPRRFRSAMAVLALLGLWAGILGGGAYWYTQRDNSTVTGSAAKVDLNGDGFPDQPLGSLTAGGPDGSADGSGGAAAGGGGGGDAAAAAEKDTKPSSAIITGTVKAGETGDDAGVNVELVPAVLGGVERNPAEQAALARGGFAGGASRSGGTAKIWPARYNRAGERGVSERRETESIISDLSDDDGVWMFPDVLIPDNYEVTFSKPGFDTQAFIVTPPEDGKTVEMEVELSPAEGAASGIVSDANGPLGGVDLVITDGVLTFSTTTSSEAGSVGTWSVTGLSTPNTYTLTATLRGYGTEVQQLPLEAGEQRTGVTIRMTAGVGAITGHITARADPLGGVTISASSGDLTRSTTSLTLGDSGSYSLPQLKIPGIYTVTATADGYMTQTREVNLTGNAADIDFSLVPTTGSITGVVVSDVAGNLPGVGITVLHDDLSFNSTTAVAPSAGSFRIDELPPGEYLVSFTRFDHADVSQLVTIAAGETRDLGTVAMTYRARPPLVETGRLLVTVFDSATTALGGATVQLTSVADGTVIRQTTDATGTESSFAFDNVPIGTYNVRVGRPDYRTASQRVTMGLGEVRLTFNLLQLGQVIGRVVDAVSVSSGGTITQLNNYELRIYRLRADGTRDGAEIERIVVPSSAVPDADGNILWQSAPTSLTDGNYEIEVSVPPVGYGVSNDQALDPDDPSTRMRFTIDSADEGTLRLADIRADPYPTLSGRIYVPRLVDAATNDIGFDPLDAAGAVELTCDGSTGRATAVLSDEVGADGSGLDTYTFSPVVLDQQNLIGNCTLRVSSAAFATTDIPLGTPLEVSSGGISTSKIVNVAIGREAPALTGTMFWIDRGIATPARVPVDTVNLITQGDVITGFRAAPPGGTELPVPILATAPVSGLNLGGTWNIVSHVFGTTRYVFTGDDRFEVGTLTITIDESNRTVVAQNLDVVDVTAASLEVGLTPLPGSIAGTVQVATTTPGPGVTATALTIDATPPGAAAITASSDPTTGAFAIDPAAAGTWDVRYTAPAGYRFRNTGLTTSDLTTSIAGPFRLEPDQDLVTNPQLVELGSLDITVAAASGVLDGAAPTVTVERIGTGLPGDPGSDASIPATLDGSNHVLITDLPVNWVDPVGTPVQYLVTVSKDGFDTEMVTVIRNGTTTTPISGTDIGVTVAAGQTSSLRIELSKFGSTTGSVLGVDPWSDPAAVPSAQADLIQPSLVITAVRRYTITDAPTAGPSGTVSVIAPTLPGTPTAFSISGPPGFYELTISHPSYATPPTLPTADPTAPVAGLYRLENGVANPIGNAVLELLPSAINVTAIDGLGDPISGAAITVTGTPTTSIPGTTTGVDGQRSIGNLGAGTYTVEVHKRNGAGVDEKFPVKVAVTIVRGENADARSVDLTVRLVSLDGSITGRVGAVNSLGRPVALPATTIMIDRAYTAGNTADVEGTPTSNQATEGDLFGTSNPPDSYEVPIVSPPETPVTFLMDNLPRGSHELTFSSEAGYTSPTGDLPGTVTPLSADIVTSAFSFPDDINYEALPVTVEVTVVSGRTSPNPPLTTATATLIPTWRPAVPGPWEPGPGTPIPAVSEVDGVFTFQVPPDLDAYTISVVDDDGLHTPNNATEITVAPSTATYVAPTIVMTPSTATIVGLAQKQAGASAATITNLVSQGTIDLLPATGTTPVAGVAAVSANGSGTYTFTGVTTTGPFRVRVDLSGHVTTISAPFSVVLGQSNDGPTVIVPALASATITVNATVTPTSPVVGVTSPATSAGVCTRTSCQFSGLTPGVAYDFQISPSSTGNDDDFYFADSTSLTPAIGASATGSVTLADRTITVQVTTTGSASDSNTATVVVDFPGTGVTTSRTGTSSSTYTFAHVPKAAGTVRVSRTLYTTNTATISEVTLPSSEPAIPVTLARAVTTVSGNITDVPSGYTGTIVVRATSNDSSPVVITGTVSGTDTIRTYSIPNVTWGTWTITADGLGAGAGTAASTVTVNGTLVDTEVRSIDLNPRTVTYNFDVTDGGGLGGVTIEMADDSGVTSSSSSTRGTVSLTQSERSSRAWTARINGYITNSGTASLIGLTNPVPVAMRSIPNIGGDVQISGSNVSFDAVYFCRPETAVGACAPAGADFIIAGTASGGTGNFTVPKSGLQLTPGNYVLRAVKGSDSASTTITIGANGTITSSIVITLPAPPATTTTTSTTTTTIAPTTTTTIAPTITTIAG